MNKRTHTTTFIIFFCCIVFIIGVSYATWRWMYTLNLFTSPFTTFWSYSLCFAEILTLIVFTNFSLILIKGNRLEKVVPDNKLQQDYSKDIYKDGELVTFKNFCPSVDIFICTLNETPDMLSTTISACKNIDYPNHKVYVLDDGKRDEIKELAELLECNYITRETNKGFKAGNINHALTITDSDIVVIFDADHIPASTFLKETIYYFINEKIALVQTPQHFCNPDAFQKNLEMADYLSNEQDTFYRIIEPSLNEYDSVFCGGTNILIRRKHLKEVDNFPENTITEDSLLGLEFHSKGYKVIYYNRPIAIGLSASSFEDYIKQRTRWAKGNVQIITNPANWKYYLKLKPAQAFFYLSSMLYFFTPLARIIYLLAPVLFLFFDILPILILFYQILAFQVCYFTLKFVFLFSARVRYSNVILADVYDLLTSLFTIGGILQVLLLPGKLSRTKFNVTKKDYKKTLTKYQYKLPVIIIFIILILAELRGIYDILYSEPYSVLAIVANLFWNFTNIIIMYFAIKVVTEKPEKRFYQRIKVDNNITIEDDKHHKYTAHTNDISRSGVSLTMPDELRDNTPKDLKANIEGEESELEILNCQDEKGDYVCKSKFKKPITLERLAKIYIYRINKFVKYAYKKPDKWDDYYDGEKRR